MSFIIFSYGTDRSPDLFMILSVVAEMEVNGELALKNPNLPNASVTLLITSSLYLQMVVSLTLHFLYSLAQDFFRVLTQSAL